MLIVAVVMLVVVPMIVLMGEGCFRVGPGGHQADGKTTAGRWERGTEVAGDERQIDFPITYFRK